MTAVFSIVFNLEKDENIERNVVVNNIMVKFLLLSLKSKMDDCITLCS